MSNKSKKGALIGGLILIALGMLFFLENWSVHFSIWRFIGRYWPVILILVGIRKLYDYFTWNEAATPPVPGSTVKE